jgi:hypothetical protein
VIRNRRGGQERDACRQRHARSADSPQLPGALTGR